MRVTQGIPNLENKVCKLLKSLYYLKQGSHQWFAKITYALQQQGYSQSKNDYSLFLKKDSSNVTISAIYVDDILMTGTNHTEILALKTYFHQEFTIKDLGILHYFLGFEVSYIQEGTVLTQF